MNVLRAIGRFIKKIFVLLWRLIKFLGFKFLIIILIAGLIYFGISRSRGGEVIVTSESSLQKIEEIAELSTLEYIYNSKVTVYEEDQTTAKYHVAYDGLVNVGIDFQNVKILVDQENKLLEIIVPQPRILDVTVDSGTLDYIYEKRAYSQDPTLAQEAYEAAVSDLETKAKANKELTEMAKQNAKNTLRSLYEPWAKEADSEFEVRVR